MLWNDQIEALCCLRCNTKYMLEERATGCPKCLATGFPVSLKVIYKTNSIIVQKQERGMKRYLSRLPFQDHPSLGEGDTPLLSWIDDGVASNMASFFIKNEAQNPTGSHKDRMSALFIKHAQILRKPGVIIASSGNAGLSLATYAAYARIPCIVVTNETISRSFRSILEYTGATLYFASTTIQRWNIVERLIAEEGYYAATNFINPPVGSNPYGVQAYKTIAFELFEQLDQSMPAAIIVPTSRGDLLWGIWEGVKELYEAGLVHTLPKMVATEPFPRLLKVMDGADYRQTFEGQTMLASIAGGTVTYQAVQALKESHGEVVVVHAEEALAAQKLLVSKGVLLESSSATILPALRELHKRKVVSKESQIIAIGTSHILKEL